MIEQNRNVEQQYNTFLSVLATKKEAHEWGIVYNEHGKENNHSDSIKNKA